MKKGRWKTGLGLTLCVIMLVTCFFPESVTALEGVTSNQQEIQQPQQDGSQSQDEADEKGNNADMQPKAQQ